METGGSRAFAPGFSRLAAFASILACVLTSPIQASLRSVLHYHRVGYFDHPAAIAACSTMLEQLSAEFRFRVKHSDDPADLLHLGAYDLVIFDNTTSAGDETNTMTPPQTALIAYMNAGGRILGIHGAADHRSLWSWYDSVLFSGTKVTYWSEGSHMIFKNDLPATDTGQALARMWKYAADSLGIPTESVSLSGEMLHWNQDAAGKPGVVVLQELRGHAAQNGVSESHAWVRFLPGGGRMLFTAMGHEAWDWTANDGWLKRASYAYMRYLAGDFDSGPDALAPRIRAVGSRLEAEPGGVGSVRVTDLIGRLIASGSGAALAARNLKPGVYFVTVKRGNRLTRKTIAIPD